MTDRETRLREIRERVEKATPGPWNDKCELALRDTEGLEIAWFYPPDTEEWEDKGTELEDSDFIAHAREDVPWLLAEVARLREELDGVKCELELRKTLHIQPEESEHIRRTSDLLIRVLSENNELRAEVGELLRISKQLDTGTAAFDYPGSAVDG